MTFTESNTVEQMILDAASGLAGTPGPAATPDRADEVIYNLRAILLSVQADGLVRANENFMAWLRGEKTMPFGHNGEHVSVRLVDAFDPAKNRLTVTNHRTDQAGPVEKRT